MIPVVAVTGTRKSGKTTLIEKIIPELRKKGYSVATVKHDVHGFEMDIPGKDTFRHRGAGARITIISSPDKLGYIEIREQEINFEEILERFIEDVDIVIAEGYKNQNIPKIEVFNGEELLGKDDENLLAVVSDKSPLDKVDKPVFKLEEAEKVADLIEEKVIKENQVQNLWLFINDRHVPLKDFIRTMFYEIIRGMMKSLKKVGEPRKVVFKVWYK